MLTRITLPCLKFGKGHKLSNRIMFSLWVPERIMSERRGEGKSFCTVLGKTLKNWPVLYCKCETMILKILSRWNHYKMFKPHFLALNNNNDNNNNKYLDIIVLIILFAQSMIWNNPKSHYFFIYICVQVLCMYSVYFSSFFFSTSVQLKAFLTVCSKFFIFQYTVCRRAKSWCF